MSKTDLHDLLDRAVEPLDTMPDAVPDVLAKGRRSVLVRRTVGATGTIVGAATAVAAIAALSGITGGSSAQPPAAGTATSTTAAPTTKPTTGASTKPTSGPSTKPSAKSTAGRSRDRVSPRPPWTAPAALVAFNRDVVAPALGEALPDRFGEVRIHPSDSGVGEFRVSAGGRTYELQMYVFNRPKGYEEQIFPCSEYLQLVSSEPQQYTSCAEQTLPDGVRAVSFEEKGDGPIHRAASIKDDRMVEISIYSTDHHEPLDNAELLATLAHPAIQAAYHTWMTHTDWMSS